jgi:hypothetical protein
LPINAVRRQVNRLKGYPADQKTVSIYCIRVALSIDEIRLADPAKAEEGQTDQTSVDYTIRIIQCGR